MIIIKTGVCIIGIVYWIYIQIYGGPKGSFSVHCTLYIVYWREGTVCNVECTVYSVQCTVYNVKCAECNV